MFLTFIFSVSVYVAVDKAILISENEAVNISVPDGFYSNIMYDSINNPISADILYHHLKTMRVPHADIITAQAVLESADFSSQLFQRQNNFLGMKIARQRISTTGQGKGEYKDYSSWQECIVDYIFWMNHHNAHKLNREEYLKLLGKIYAEDPEYISKVEKIVKTLN